MHRACSGRVEWSGVGKSGVVGCRVSHVHAAALQAAACRFLFLMLVYISKSPGDERCMRACVRACIAWETRGCFCEEKEGMTR